LREPTQAEVDFQVTYGIIPSGRVVTAYAFLVSPEFQVKLGPQMSAFLLYSCLLQRDATVAELNLRATQIQQGTPYLQLISEFVASAEFNALLQ
jgi:hypothetical protein